MYNLVARNRETMNYERIGKPFTDERQFHYMVDQVDREKYSEAMIIQDTKPIPTQAFYQEFRKHEKAIQKTKRK